MRIGARQSATLLLYRTWRADLPQEEGTCQTHSGGSNEYATKHGETNTQPKENQEPKRYTRALRELSQVLPNQVWLIQGSNACLRANTGD
jgi:hypothetical protein